MDVNYEKKSASKIEKELSFEIDDADVLANLRELDEMLNKKDDLEHLKKMIYKTKNTISSYAIDVYNLNS